MNGEEQVLELEERGGVNIDEAAIAKFFAEGGRIDPMPEKMLHDMLEVWLEERGFDTVREMVVKPRDRVDLAVIPNDQHDLRAIIELKTAEPIKGVGQVLSYQAGVPELVHRVLVVDGGVLTGQVVRACKVAEIELWALMIDEFRYITGPPKLWDAASPEESRSPYQPFEPGAKMCPTCNGITVVPPEAPDIDIPPENQVVRIYRSWT